MFRDSWHELLMNHIEDTCLNPKGYHLVVMATRSARCSAAYHLSNPIPSFYNNSGLFFSPKSFDQVTLWIWHVFTRFPFTVDCFSFVTLDWTLTFIVLTFIGVVQCTVDCNRATLDQCLKTIEPLLNSPAITRGIPSTKEAVQARCEWVSIYHIVICNPIDCLTESWIAWPARTIYQRLGWVVLLSEGSVFYCKWAKEAPGSFPGKRLDKGWRWFIRVTSFFYRQCCAWFPFSKPTTDEWWLYTLWIASLSSSSS